MYGIYNIYNNTKLIYTGKTNNFLTRLKTHVSLQPWRNEITHIAIAECKTKVDMDLYEKYYINKLKPKYNKAIVYNETPTFAVEELIFKKFSLKEFFDRNKPKTQKNNDINKNYEKYKKEINDLIKTSIKINKDEKIDFLNSTNVLYYWNDSLNTNIYFLQVEGDLIFFKEILKGIKNNICMEFEDKYVFIYKNREDIFENSDLYHLGLTINNYSISQKRISKGFSGVNFVYGIKLDPKTKDVKISINKYMLNEYFSKYFIY